MKPFELQDVSRLGPGYQEFIRERTLSVGVYKVAAGAVDTQHPHGQDEVYIITSGRAMLRIEDTDHPVQAGSIIFVPANVEHRFHSITEDLTTLGVFSPPYAS